METTKDGSEKAKVVKKQIVPAADIDFGTVMTTASNKWETNSWLLLLWLTSATFKANSIAYNALLDTRLNAGTAKPRVAKALGNLDKKMDDHLSYVKGYITDKFKKEDAESYFSAFGIEHKDERYSFPRDQNRRLASLKLMVDGIGKYEFKDKEFGIDFWSTIKSEYELLLTKSTAIDGDVSVKVGGKNVLKNNLKKGANSLIFAIKANYPDTYKQELRDWGFQKEKY